MLAVREDLPTGLLDCPAAELYRLLEGPTLFHLAGRRARPLFVSTLLHGNEVSGLMALQRLLRRYRRRELPRALSVFLGNVDAARLNKRYLPGQPDFNRIWCDGRGEEHEMTRDILRAMRRRDVFASIDVHNNTGRNPLYAIVADRGAEHLALASRFAATVVYATYPDTTCTYAFSELCPATTLECGLSADDHGVTRVVEFIDACLNLPDGEIGACDTRVDLFHTVAVVTISQACSFGFTGEDVDLQFDRDIDHYNFQELAPGTRLAIVRDGGDCLQVTDMSGHHSDGYYLEISNGEVRVARPVMPAMLTTDREVISMDCLCYLMERLE